MELGFANNHKLLAFFITGSGGGTPWTLTTTGTSGPATYTANVLNIPQYSGISFMMTQNLQAANLAMPVGAKTYYCQVRALSTYTMSKVLIQASSGSGTTRVAVYTGLNNNPAGTVLKAQSESTNTVTTGPTSLALLAENGNDLNITAGSDYILALTTSSLTLSYHGYAVFLDTNSWGQNTADLDTAGFGTNIQVLSSMSECPCMIVI